MMNGLALFLVLTAIGTGGFFSPRAEKNSNNKREDLIVKETNRVILVEYETESRPRGSLSPPPPSPSSSEPSSLLEDKLSIEADIVNSAKNKFKEASSVLPNLGQGISDDSSPSNDHQHHYNAKELICDAYGKCKHKLAGVFGKANKEAAVDKVHDAEDVGGAAIGKTKEAYDKAKENMEGAEKKTKEAVGKAEESVFETGHKAIGTAKEGWGKAKETGDMTMQVSKEGLTKAGEGVFDLAHEVEEIKKNAAKKVLKTAGVFEENLDNAEECVYKLAQEVIEQKKRAGNKILEAGEIAIGKTKEAVGKAKESVSEKGKEFKEFVVKKVHELEETGEKAVEKTKEGVGKAKETMYETGEMAMDKATEGFAKTGESVHEKAQEVKERTKEAEEKVREDMRIIGKVVKKGHDSIVDHRSIRTKAGGLLKEGCMNFSIMYGRGREAVFDAAKYAVAPEVVYPALGVLHLLGLATAYGLSVWVTFVSSYVLSVTLPRQQFGIVQSKIYPVYFKALLGSIGCSLLAHTLRHPHWGLNSFQAHNMLACLGLVLFNLLYLEPQATKVMFDKMKLDKEEGRGTTSEQQQMGEPTTSTTAGITETGVTGITETGVAGEPIAGRVEVPEEVTSRLRELNRRLKNLNTISSLLNVVTLMSVTWQLVYLGRGLSVT
ncbi:late embryogenesis abundant domain-containing protein / LEA domain-containing protein [Thalictrum thalictroides]|uniref:Late embryogenesis abundant domain-containing protein / LEA domain-containing protein n=1 Tax=Thalictrum thalictroides TaxID=46969 RepID=A0A7J6W4P2_THATH|nr:late embryogenesis abundant domain-containing protein / LEA domain-containing protein [Thalictrum thalictroides]